MTLVIMQPEEEPVTKILFGSALCVDIAQLTILTRPPLSPPSLRERLSGLDTSQHLSLLRLLGNRIMNPFSSA